MFQDITYSIGVIRMHVYFSTIFQSALNITKLPLSKLSPEARQTLILKRKVKPFFFHCIFASRSLISSSGTTHTIH